MKIILVRHGQSEHNIGATEDRDSNLTEKGRKQAEALGKKLKKEKIKIDELYTSHLKRAKQTAEIISKHIKVPVKERFSELNEYHEWHLVNKIEGAFSSRLRALRKFLKKISKDRLKDKTMMIVAHGRTNKIITAHLLRIPIGKHLMRLMHHNTSFHILEWSEQFKNWRLESWNDFKHLSGDMK